MGSSRAARPEPGRHTVAVNVVIVVVVVLLAAAGFGLVWGGSAERADSSLANPGANLLVPRGAPSDAAPLTRTGSGRGTRTGATPETSSAPTTTPIAAPTPVTAPAPVGIPIGPAPVVSRVATADRVLFLGIDDGLTRDPAVLDFLAANRIPFTAFVVASPLTVDPSYWARARAIGGTIEAHTLTHPNLTKLSADQVRREVCGSADAIEAATGTRPTLFRPPYGAYNDTVRAVATQCGFAALVMWKGSTNDGRVDLQEQVLKPGDILLMHWRPDLLQNLQNVVALAREQGFRIAKLESYLQPLP